MKQVFIFGAGGASKSLLGQLNKEVLILGFLDNDPAKAGTLFCGHPVYPPSVLMNSKYDHILICSTYHEAIEDQLVASKHIDDRKIINIHKLFYDFSLRSRMESFAEVQHTVECIATGISYTMVSIIPDLMDCRFFNFALSGQDLYYDYKIWRYIFENYDVKKLKFACIGLARYSLHYDMSKRRDRDIISRYIYVLGDYNHSPETQVKIDSAMRLLKPGFMDAIYADYRDHYKEKFKQINKDTALQTQSSTATDYKSAYIAKREHKKFYPETRLQNRVILHDLITLLFENNIMPLFMCIPAPKSYTNNVPQWMEREFLEEINGLFAQYNVPFLDLLRDDDFGREHFLDDSHLNTCGARLFTLKLNAFLKSLP